MDQRRGAVALVDRVIADSRLPEDLAVEIEGGAEDGVGVGEGDEEAATVSGNGRRRAGRFLVLSHRPCGVDLTLPKLLAGGPVIREHRLAAGRLVAGGEIDPAPHDRRRAVASAGNIDRPDNMLGVAPGVRHDLPGTRLAVVGRAAPAGPIVRGRRRGSEGRCPGRHHQKEKSRAKAAGERQAPGSRAGDRHSKAPEGLAGLTCSAEFSRAYHRS